MTELTKFIDKAELDARKKIEEINALSVLSESDYDVAAKWLKLTSQAKKSVQDMVKKELASHKAAVDEIKNKFKKPIELFEEAETITRQKINAYLAADRKVKEAAALAAQSAAMKAAEKEIKKIDKLAGKADKYDQVTAAALKQQYDQKKEELLANAAATPDIVQSTDNTSVRMVWDFEIENIKEIPAEFLTVNSSAIRAAIRAGRREVPGLKIFQKPQVAIK